MNQKINNTLIIGLSILAILFFIMAFVFSNRLEKANDKIDMINAMLDESTKSGIVTGNVALAYVNGAGIDCYMLAQRYNPQAFIELKALNK